MHLVAAEINRLTCALQFLRSFSILRRIRIIINGECQLRQGQPRHVGHAHAAAQGVDLLRLEKQTFRKLLRQKRRAIALILAARRNRAQLFIRHAGDFAFAARRQMTQVHACRLLKRHFCAALTAFTGSTRTRFRRHAVALFLENRTALHEVAHALLAGTNVLHPRTGIARHVNAVPALRRNRPVEIGNLLLKFKHRSHFLFLSAVSGYRII